MVRMDNAHLGRAYLRLGILLNARNLRSCAFEMES